MCAAAARYVARVRVLLLPPSLQRSPRRRLATDVAPAVSRVLSPIVIAVACVVGVVAIGAGCGGVTLDDVRPAEVAPGATITLTGSGFDDALAVRLESPSGAVVALVPEQVAPTSAAAVLPPATPAGVYDVVVAVGEREARLEAALTVRKGALRVRFLDVGQGDATLVTGPDGSALLIDGGNRDAGAYVEAALQQATAGRLDAVAITHTDADHLGGVVHVLRGADGVAGSGDDVVPATRWIGHDDGLCDSQLCDEFRALRARFQAPLVDDTLDLGGATVRVLGRDGDFGGGAVAGADSENERSLALLVTFAERRVFIAGDLTGGGLGDVDVEADAARKAGVVDVLHVNHHGSATSSSEGFLRALQPRVVVVSVGTDNAFCHPAAAVVDRLAALGAPVWATGEGMAAEAGRCDAGRTAWPAGARAGAGDITLTIDADGAMAVNGEALP
jgi:competence protein ComEC